MEALVYAAGTAAFFGGLMLLIRLDPQGFRDAKRAELAADRPTA